MPGAIVLAAALIVAPGSYAEAESNSPGVARSITELYSLEKLVVSATRTERPRFTTPAAIASLDQGDIRQIQPYGYQDLFEQLPGVNIFGGPRRIAEEPAIRGFADEQVAIRVDGARQNFNKAHGGRFFVDPALIESVEVLRGASSAVWGSGALGGAFIIRTSSGRDRTGGRNGLGLRSSLGFDDNGDQRRAAATAYGQHGGFDWLVGAVGRDVGEDLTDGQGDDILATQDDLRSGQIKLGFEPDIIQRFELSFERFENDGRNPPNANTAATATNLVDRTTKREQTRLSYRADDPESSWLDLSLTAYDNNIFAREFRLIDQRVDATDFQTRGIELVNSAELGSISGQPVRLTVGAEYYIDQQGGLRNGADRPQFPDAEVDYRALFAQAEIDLPSGWSLIPGLRFDAFEYASTGDFPSRDDKQTTPRLALGWQPIDSTYFWVEYAEAFRAPSLTELFADGVHFVAPLGPGQVVINEFVPTPDLAPEHASQVQIGGRWRAESLFGSSLSLDLEATAWRSRVDDFVDQIVIFIAGDPVFDPATQTLVFPGITTNRSVDARLEGAELSATLQHRRGYLRANATVVDGQRRDTGEDLASVQPDRLAIGAGLYFLDRQLTVGGEVILSSSRDDVPEGALATPGYGKTDLFVGYVPTAGALNGFEFRLALDNVFDKDYRIHPNGIDQPGRSIRFSIASEFQWLAQ